MNTDDAEKRVWCVAGNISVMLGENVDCSKEKMSVWNRKEVFMFNVKKIIKKISVCCVMAALITGMLSGCGKKNENSKNRYNHICCKKS